MRQLNEVLWKLAPEVSRSGRRIIEPKPNTPLKGDPMLINRFKSFFTDESGLELTEYAVGAALIAVACIIAFTNLGTTIAATISNLTSTIAG